MNRLEGANCADLPGFVVDKYFNCNVNREPLRAQVAKAICARCVVLDECRDVTLNQPNLPDRGIVAGLPARHFQRARSWRRYELGLTETPPRAPRPEWLARPEAAETTEQGLVEIDPDELPVDR